MSNPAWRPAGVDPKQSKWTATGRIFRFDGAGTAPTQPGGAVDAPQFLELTGKDFHDNYGYNLGGGWQIVSDLRLAATVNWQGGAGSIQLCLSKYDDLYTIELHPREGMGRTLHAARSQPQDERELKAWSFPAWKPNQPVRVSFANVDRHLEVRIHDRVIWQQDFPTTAAATLAQLARYPAGYENNSPIVRIGAAGLKAELAHLLVNRDVYYQDNVPIVTIEGLTHRVYNEYSDKPGWATRGNPMLLRDGEYFMLGDNSPASLDSRRWWQIGAHLAGRSVPYRVGTVPADQMIGKAFFVYWPSWYRLWNIPNLRVIPNIGEMRWIQ
jgi:hypothetical protein